MVNKLILALNMINTVPRARSNYPKEKISNQMQKEMAQPRAQRDYIQKVRKTRFPVSTRTGLGLLYYTHILSMMKCLQSVNEPARPCVFN